MKPYSYSVDSIGKITPGNEVNSPIGMTSITASVVDFKMKSIFYQIGGTVKVNNGETTNAGTENYKITNISYI